MAGAALICGAILAAVRAVNATLPVHLPGWSPGGQALAPAACQTSIDTRLAAMHDAPGGFTGAGHHPYCFNGPLAFGMPTHKDWNPFQQTPDVYAAAKAAGCAGPMALSEYGCPSAGTQDEYPQQTFTEDIQESIIVEYLVGFAAQMKAGIPIAYMGLSTAIDGEASTRPLENSMGMFRANGSEKPAAQHIRAQAHLPYPVAA
ncbi:MAG TPA: hypothetical protein VGN59_06990 [Acidimicrobiia bacterium]